MYRKIIKPFLDKFLALFLFFGLLPFIIVALTVVSMIQKPPLFFKQCRSGMNKRHIWIYKIRTLDSDTFPSLSLENRRFSTAGRWLRRYGLDELPQLWNILKGEMSFIGPRPMPVEYDERYQPDQEIRFRCKPGITGWAQVHGRNDITWQKRFELDRWYVDHISFTLDLRIVFYTVIQIFSKGQEAEMPVFTGNNTK